MKSLLIFLILLSSSQAISPKRTIVVYNSDSAESRYVAQHYKKVRNIPEEHLIGLSLPVSGSMTIEAFQNTLLKPLKSKLDRDKLWNLWRAI